MSLIPRIYRVQPGRRLDIVGPGDFDPPEPDELTDDDEDPETDEDPDWSDEP